MYSISECVGCDRWRRQLCFEINVKLIRELLDVAAMERPALRQIVIGP